MPTPREAHRLIAEGRLDEALDLTTALTSVVAPSAAALGAHAAALKAQGRLAEALAANRLAVAAFGDNGIAWHNLASTLGDLGLATDSEASAKRAIELGVRAPETYLVLGRAVLAQGDDDAAQTWFRHALALRPTYLEAHRDLAQLIWMRTADGEAALANLNESLAAHPGHAGLLRIKAAVLGNAEDFTGALEATEMGLATAPTDLGLLTLAVDLSATAGNGEDALRYARRAARTTPQRQATDILLAKAHLAVGEAAQAEAVAQRAVARQPEDQYALALLATAWRLMGDPRYAELYDYPAMVGVFDLEAPAGWPSIETLLNDVGEVLSGLHRYSAPPFSQSASRGSQATLRLDVENAPAVDALLGLMRQALLAFVTGLGSGSDPLRARNTGGADISSAWTVQLGPGERHGNHVHPRGWISSACYISLPSFSQPGEGWLRFGEPGVRTVSPLPPEHQVEPRPGRLVLFPSYLWHGTAPFAAPADATRLTVAFDALPSPHP